MWVESYFLKCLWVFDSLAVVLSSFVKLSLVRLGEVVTATQVGTVILVSSTHQELLSCCAVATCFPLLQLVVLGFAFSVVFVVPFVRGTAAHVGTFAVCQLWQEAMGRSNLRRLVFEGVSLVE